MRIPPTPPKPTRVRSQVESFFVLRRNPLELWGEPAFHEDVLPGRFLGRDQIMLNAPEAVRHVLVANAENYGRNVATERVLRPVLGEGLFLAEGEAWRHQRRTIAPALAPRAMPLLIPHILAVAAAFEARFAATLHRPIELLPALQLLALDVAGRSMFSLEMAGFGGELRALILRYAQHFARPGPLDMVVPRGRNTLLDRGRARFRADWTAFIDRLVAARRAQPAGEARDLFDLLAAARDPETGQGFNDAQLRDEIATLIIAGHETTAITLFWALYLAALYPELQDRIAREAASTSDVSAMPYTRAFIDETLRLYPAAFLLVREARGPDEIMGRPIAAGTVVSIVPWVIHRHRRFWRDPDVFDPERFLPGAPPPERFTYLPFGAGPRICVGAQFALTEAVLILGRLLARFRVALVGSAAVLPRALVTVQPDRPVRFVLGERERLATAA